MLPPPDVNCVAATLWAASSGCRRGRTEPTCGTAPRAPAYTSNADPMPLLVRELRHEYFDKERRLSGWRSVSTMSPDGGAPCRPEPDALNASKCAFPYLPARPRRATDEVAQLAFLCRYPRRSAQVSRPSDEPSMTVDLCCGLRFRAIRGSEQIASHARGSWFEPSRAHRHPALPRSYRPYLQQPRRETRRSG